MKIAQASGKQTITADTDKNLTVELFIGESVKIINKKSGKHIRAIINEDGYLELQVPRKHKIVDCDTEEHC